MSSLRQSYRQIADPRKFPIQRSFTDDGTLTGDPNMNVDGSVTPKEFYFQAEANRFVQVDGVSFSVSDAGNTTVNDYGGVAGPLTNGVTLYTISNGQEIPLTPIIKRAADFFAIGSDSQFVELSGSSRLAVYSFSLFDYSEGILLNEGDIFGIRINDNLAGLTLHKASLDGFFQFNAAWELTPRAVPKPKEF